MLTGYYQKTKRGFQKRLAKGTKNLSEEGKTKSTNMLVSDIESF